MLDFLFSPLYVPVGGLSLLCIGAFVWARRCGQILWYLFALGVLFVLIGWSSLIVLPMLTPNVTTEIVTLVTVAFTFLGVWLSAITMLVIAFTMNTDEKSASKNK